MSQFNRERKEERVVVMHAYCHIMISNGVYHCGCVVSASRKSGFILFMPNKQLSNKYAFSLNVNTGHCVCHPNANWKAGS